MQIALTKKLAEAIGIKPTPVSEATEPIFSWTANWQTHSTAEKKIWSLW